MFAEGGFAIDLLWTFGVTYRGGLHPCMDTHSTIIRQKVRWSSKDIVQVTQ